MKYGSSKRLIYFAHEIGHVGYKKGREFYDGFKNVNLPV
jgi:hypothetical protein